MNFDNIVSGSYKENVQFPISDSSAGKGVYKPHTNLHITGFNLNETKKEDGSTNYSFIVSVELRSPKQDGSIDVKSTEINMFNNASLEKPWNDEKWTASEIIFKALGHQYFVQHILSAFLSDEDDKELIKIMPFGYDPVITGELISKIATENATTKALKIVNSSFKYVSEKAIEIFNKLDAREVGGNIRDIPLTCKLVRQNKKSTYATFPEYMKLRKDLNDPKGPMWFIAFIAATGSDLAESIGYTDYELGIKDGKQVGLNQASSAPYVPVPKNGDLKADSNAATAESVAAAKASFQPTADNSPAKTKLF